MLIDVRVRYDGMNSTTRQAMIFIQEIIAKSKEDLISGDVIGDLDEKKSGFGWLIWLMTLLIVGIILWTVWYLFEGKIKDYLYVKKIRKK
jgi:hypothetical protein